MIKEFTGWIDERDLKQVKVMQDGKFWFRLLHIFDKHWDNRHWCKVKVQVLEEKK